MKSYPSKILYDINKLNQKIVPILFYGNEEGRYTQKINKNPDLIKLLGKDCNIYGPVFKFNEMPDFF